MQLKYFTFIIGTIFVGLVSGRQLLAFNHPGDGGAYPYQQGNGGGPPQRNPPPYNPMNPQQPNNNGRNDPVNQPHNYPNNNGRHNPRYPQQPPHYPNNNGRNNPRRPQRLQHPHNNGRNNPMNPQQPPQYPNNNGRNNPMNPQQPPQYPNNNGRNNPMNHPNPYQPAQYPNNVERNNPMNPANQYQPPQPPYNNGRSNPSIPDQQQPHRQMPNNHPPRPNMRRRNPNARPGFPKRPNGRNRRPQAETTQASTVPKPLYSDDDLPPGFVEDMLASLAHSVVPQSEEPTENNLPPSTIAETHPPIRNPHNRRPYQRPRRRRPGHRRKPSVATTFNPLVTPKTTFADEMISQAEENYVFPTDTVSVDAEKATPVVPDGVFSETTAEEISELFTVLTAIESSTQSNDSKADEIKDSNNEISSDIYETSTPEIITKSELEPVITTEATTEKIATAEILTTSSALDATEIIEIIHVHAPEVETIPDINTSLPTDIPDHSEEIKTDDQPTTESPETNKDKSEYTQATQTSVAEEKTTSESITSSSLPATTELSDEVTTVALTSHNAEANTQAQTRESETTLTTQTPLATTTIGTTMNEITSVSSSAATASSQSSSAESDIFHIKSGDSEFMPVFTKSPSKDKIVSTTVFLPKTTCYCTDGITYVTTESLENIKKTTIPFFTSEEAHTKYSEVSNIGVTTPSYTSVATPKKTEENGVTLDTNAKSGSTQADSDTGATTPNIEDLGLTTSPTITSTVSAVTSTASSAEPSDLTTQHKDENHTDDEVEDLHDLMNDIFDENYYETEIPPPGVTCRENESYYKCIPNCRHTCLNYDNFDVPCPRICIPGCSCNKGLVIDENNKCVKVSECKDYTCKDDEDWWECMPKNHNTCDTLARANAKKDFVCESGCFCMEGLIKAPDGRCVKPDKCPAPVCSGKREEATNCVNACNTCEAMCEKPNFCSFTDCRPGCDCLGGYKRDANGTCIKASKCPACPTKPPSTTTTTIDTTTVQPNYEKTSPAHLVETTPAQAAEATPAKAVETTAAKEAETTPAPSKGETTATQKAETAPAPSKVETTSDQEAETSPAPSKVETTLAQEAETSPAPSKVETTPAPSKVESTPAPSKVETTSAQEAETSPAPSKVETTPAPSKVETTPAPSKVESTSAPSKVETTPAASKAETTTPTAVDSTTLSEPEKPAQTSTPVETTAEVSPSTTD